MTIIMDEITELHIKQDLKELEKKIDAILKRLDELEQDNTIKDKADFNEIVSRF